VPLWLFFPVYPGWELNNRQGYTATLVKLTFKAKQVGSYTINGDLYLLKDESGNDLIHVFGPVGSAIVNVIKGKKHNLAERGYL
jgi:hypothetical protein